jgi:hypothetical protein
MLQQLLSQFRNRESVEESQSSEVQASEDHNSEERDSDGFDSDVLDIGGLASQYIDFNPPPMEKNPSVCSVQYDDFGVGLPPSESY